jgi:hypothetical protein
VTVGDGAFKTAHGETLSIFVMRECVPENWQRQLFEKLKF